MQPKDRNPDRRTVLIGGIVSGLATAGAAAGAATAAGEVDQIKGMAHAVAGAASRTLARQAPVYLGDVVSTERAARLALKLGSRTELKLGELTRIKIDRYIVDAGGVIELLDGAINFERKGPPAASDLTFRGAYGLIAVRGTRFYAGPSNNVFGVLVGHGRVEVTSGGKTVSIGPGQGTDIARSGAQPTPPKNWGLARIRALQSRFK